MTPDETYRTYDARIVALSNLGGIAYATEKHRLVELLMERRPAQAAEARSAELQAVLEDIAWSCNHDGVLDGKEDADGWVGCLSDSCGPCRARQALALANRAGDAT